MLPDCLFKPVFAPGSAGKVIPEEEKQVGRGGFEPRCSISLLFTVFRCLKRQRGQGLLQVQDGAEQRATLCLRPPRYLCFCFH